MRIAILTAGSMGDVVPYVALAKGLVAAGHDVTVAAHEEFEALVRGHGLEYRPVRGNPREIVSSPEGIELLESATPVQLVRRLGELTRPLAQQWVADAAAASAEADAEAICYSLLGFQAQGIADELGVPGVLLSVAPVTASETYPTVVTPFVTPFRRLIGRGIPILYGFSPSVVPPAPEWGDNVAVCGYWFLDRDPAWMPPSGLQAFLDAGPPPVVAGFGSMGDRDPVGLARSVIEACDAAGQRCVLLSGWGGAGSGDLPPTVFATEAVPHDWLFPRAAAVIHHGGAMTTAAGIRAGVPTVCVPYAFDQHWWGERVEDLGAGPASVPRRTLTTSALTGAVERAVTDDGIREAAATLGERVRADDGVAAGVAAFERAVSGPA